MTDKKTILVVEDDGDSRFALCTILEALGFTPVSFGNPKEAKDRISGLSFDLAMLDIMMPEINGYDILQEIKKYPQHLQVPVFMVTAKDEPENVLEGYKFGADYYISKPYTMQQLKWAIQLFMNPETRPV